MILLAAREKMLEKKENLAINLGKIREEGYFFFI
jgi:hypothetical protein